MFVRTIRIRLHERSVLFKNSLPTQAYGPGRHRVWGFNVSEQRWDTTELVFKALPEVRAVVPESWYREVIVGSGERAVLFRDGVPKVFLRPGTHRYWVVDASVTLKIFDVAQPLPALTDELAALIPKSEYVDVTVAAHEKGLRFEQGRLVEVLEPGRYKLWTHPEAKAEVRTVDMRRTQVALAAQELMTRDKVTLRLSLSAEYAIVDPALVVRTLTDLRDTLYLMVQLATREYVAQVTLDELLERRDAMTDYLERAVVPKARAFGVAVERLGVKDIVLPGEMKTLLNRVIEAEKEAAANVILRREETAATRSLANTARVMAEQPVLLRLKELEALKAIAAEINEVRVVVGSEGLATLLPAQLLSKTGP